MGVMESIDPNGTAASAYLQEYPLSHGQRALWFLYEMAPEAVAYNLAGAATIPGDTDLNALQRAFRRLAQRHPMLRTTFAVAGGEPVQRVHPNADVAFDCQDASAWSPPDLDKHLTSVIHRPFDLEHGPAWRVFVFQGAPVLGDNPQASGVPNHLVLLTLHHIVADLWSTAILMSETAALYLEETTGARAHLKPFLASYADHVYRERDMLAGPRGDASWDYWRNVLEGDLPPLNLPTDHPRLPVQSDHGASYSFLLEPALTDRLKALAAERQVAMYTVLLAALQTLLHRYTGQNDILIGFPKAGRSAATARVVGYFVNPVAIRARFTEDPRFSDVLLRTQQAIEEGAEHDWYPFPLLVSRLRPSRDLSRSPLFQVMFAWQKTTRLVPKGEVGVFALGQAGQGVDVGGLPVRPVPTPHGTYSFDLAVSAAEVAGGLALMVEYNADLFDEPTITRLAQCYETLLDSVTAAPDRPVSLLTILTDDERRQLLVDWNATAAPFPELCLHQLFEQQAERWPDIVALACEGQELTYRQLNRRANQLARYLMQQGVAPGSPVGLCCEPSLQAIIGLLGILKAGATYVPLDPYYPPDRRAYMLNDTGATVLITHAATRDRLPGFSGAIVDLDADWPVISQQADTTPPSPVSGGDPAYIIFTSGSTGQPKGCALAHRGVVNLLTDCQRRQPITPGDPCSWWTSISFDVSVYEIFSALLAGGTLHVIPQAVRLDAPALLDWLNAHRIRHAYLPPFLLADFDTWLQGHPGRSELRRLLVGVEPIPKQQLISISTQLPALRIINGYGPSETTVCSTLYDVDATRPARGKTPIGKPVLNTQIYLLDRHRQPVPVGVTGEIYIGGIGLASGYLNCPDLTAERFVPNPLSGQPDARLYRTGDLARYLPDGNLEFLGRQDDQLKIHGVRIEPAEIEAAIALHPAVRGVAVQVRPDQRGDSRLVAYLVSTQSPPPSSNELRRFLAQSLPEYMVPSTFVVLDALPLTPSGKLDRRGLPAPEDVRPQPGRVFREPQTRAEEILVAIWQRVLGVEAIGVDDNFFELGGDSIMAMQVVSQAAQAGLHLSPKHLFQAPTVAGLAVLADADTPALPSIEQPEQAAPAGACPLTPIQHWVFEQDFPHSQHRNQSLMFSTSRPLEPTGNLTEPQGAQLDAEPAYPLSPMQQGMLFHTLNAPDSGVYIQQLTCDIAGSLDGSAFSDAWQQALDRHTILRTSFISERLDRMLQVVHKDVKLPLDVRDWRALPAAEQQTRFDALLTAERRHGFDPGVAPLWHLTLVRAADNLYRCLFSHHHALLDGWSLALLFQEVFALYESVARNQDRVLPPARPYRDYIAWLQTQDLAAAESFWRAALAGCAPGPSLPIQSTPQPAPEFALPAERKTRLTVAGTAALTTMARQQRLTLNTLVQGAWALLLGRYSQQGEIIYGTTVAGRPADLVGSESMVGLFINTQPMRVHLDPRAPLIGWLDQLQRQAAEARQYDYCPLVRIQEWGGARPGQSLFDTVLAFENYPIDAILFEGRGGLRISNVRAIQQTNYPLAMAVTPGQELRLEISFDRVRFEPAAVDSLLDDLHQLLDRMAATRDRPLAEVAQLPEHLTNRCLSPASPVVVLRPAHATPQGALQLYLARLWAEVLEVENIGAHDDFFDLGGDSLRGAVLMSRLRRELSEDIRLAAIFDAPTIAELADYLDRNHPWGVAQLLGRPPAAPSQIATSPALPTLPPALVPIQPRGTRPPLFCIHPAGGIVFPYYTLARHLGEDQPLYGLQDPSLFGTRAPSCSIEEMAADYLGALRTVQARGPYHLVGWSVGGVIAYEIAQQLSRHGERVAHLVILDTGAPGRASAGRHRFGPGRFGSLFASGPKPLLERVQEFEAAVPPVASHVRSGLFLLAASARRNQATTAGSPTAVDLAGWAILDTWRKRLLEEADVASVVSRNSSLLLLEMPDVRRILSRVWQHIQLAQRYSAETYQGRVALFRALSSRANGQRAGDPSLGWAGLATDGVDIRIIRANHVALLVNPYAKTLARELAGYLDHGQSSPDGSNGAGS